MAGVRYARILYTKTHWILLAFALLLPLLDLVIPREYQFTDLMRPIFIFAVLGLGLNIVTGYTGLLNLGVAAFMAIGAYSYAILTCDIYPFQIGFWPALALTLVIGACAGAVLGLPTLRLRGDYLAIVTLGFGEMVQDSLKNLESITKGIQGINPLPNPVLFSYTFRPDQHLPWYYLFLGILCVMVLLNRNLEHSRIGRAWIAIREDELAATCAGVNPMAAKLLAFAMGASLCSLSGALWACYLGSSGEPGNYDFQISTIALCIVIVGGMGNVSGVLLGAFVMIGFNSIVLVKVSSFLTQKGMISSGNVLSNPNNWKYMIFGFALILTMRFRPEGLLPSRRVKAELHLMHRESMARAKKAAAK
ncbi:MAG: branched-chain amino acid ABC transporter permease [Candidatus Hydrogenedentes bacterium]|nr:branched-chain amino acid ABC transporter permease [Candidatus Hydrogenedentota bacterium]